jgi:hypothetical protein
MVIDFRAIRAASEQRQIMEAIEAFDSSEYDVEAMKMDARHNNFSLDRAEDYRHTAIVHASLVNGQFEQARKQCVEYGLTYEVELSKFRRFN